MELQDIANALSTHELNSKMRFEVLREDLQKHIATEVPPITQGTTMESPVIKNIFEPSPYGNAGAGMLGGGLGAGVVGGLLSQTLLGRNGLNGVDGVNVVTPALLQTSLNQVQSNTDNAIAAAERLTTARFDSEAQREIQAAIERTASATQLAYAVGNSALGVEIAKGQGEINTQVALTTGNLGTQNALNAQNITTQIAKTSGDLGTQLALQGAALGVQVEKVATANIMGQKDLLLATNAQFSQAQLTAMQNANIAAAQLAAVNYGLSTAVKADGDQTRALINKLNDDTLNRLLTTAQNEIIELRGDREGVRRSRETEVNVTQNVTTNQNQLQAQAQQQQQFQILANLAAQVGNLANDIQVVRQTQSNVNFGVQGTAGQTASAANTRVN
jgi:hypothetical protein